jgi:tetratricopeptide (TPR) repeat protein
MVGAFGEVLVMDWGLAKVLAAGGEGDEIGDLLGEETLIQTARSGSGADASQAGAVMGTPSYMSPEQARGQVDRVDARVDVFALGAILCEILTGGPPYVGPTHAEVVRLAAGAELADAWDRLGACTADPELVALARRCLAADPADRPRDAGEVAREVTAYLAGVQERLRATELGRVEAQARAQEERKRRRVELRMSAALLAVLAAGIAGVATQWRRAEHHLADARRANTKLTEANAATKQALAETQTEKTKTEEALAQSEAVSTFLVEAFRSPDPSQDGRTIKLVDVLDRAAEKLDKEFAGSQATKGALLDALGETYRGLGLYERAETTHTKARAVRESALGPDHPDTLNSRNNLAVAYYAAGRTAEAIALHEATLKLYEAKLGPDHPDTLTGRNNLAAAYRAAGRTAEAIRLHEATLKLYETKLGPDHPTTLTGRNNLALAYESLGRWADAESLRSEVLALRRKTTLPDSPLLAGDLAGLGLNLLKQAKWSEAETLLREGLTIYAKARPDDWLRFNTMSLLGGALLGQGRYAEAEPLIVPGYEGLKARAAKIPAPDKPRLSEVAERVVRLYEAWGQPEQAKAWKAKLGLADLPADVFARP